MIYCPSTPPPQGGPAWLWVNAYWIVDDDHILFYKGSPQCNMSEKVMLSSRDNRFPDAEVRQLRCVYGKMRRGEMA